MKINVLKNTVVMIKILKNMYFDVIKLLQVKENQNLNIEFTPYEGLEFSVNDNVDMLPSLTINSGILGNYNLFTGMIGCWGDNGYSHIVTKKGYYNFYIVGNPEFDFNTGVYSSINATDCLICSKPFIPGSNTWKITVNITTGSSFANGTILGCYSGWYTGYFMNLMVTSAGKLKLYMASTKTTAWGLSSARESSLTLSTSTNYTITLEFTGSEYVVAVTQSDGYFSLGPTEYISFSSTTKIYPCNNAYILFGVYSSYIFNGTINFANTKIEIADEIYWQPYSTDVKNLEPGLFNSIANREDAENGLYYLLYDNDNNKNIYINPQNISEGKQWCANYQTSNYDITALPIKTEITSLGNLLVLDKWVEFFSNNNYFITNEEITWQNKLQIVMPIVTSGFFNTNQALLWQYNNDDKGIEVVSGVLSINNGTEYSGNTLSIYTQYWIKYEYNNSTSYLYYILDNGQYDEAPDVNSDDWVLSSSVAGEIFERQQKIAFGINAYSFNKYWVGKIGLENMKIYADDEVVWQALA